MLILEPHEFGCSLVDGDQVFLAVAVKIRGDKLVAELQLVGDDMLAESRQFLAERPLHAKSHA